MVTRLHFPHFLHPESLSLFLSLVVFFLFWQKQIILFASIFAVIFASKDQLNGGGGDGGLVTAESGITTNHIYSAQTIQDNIAAESEVAKRGAASGSSTSSTSGSESQGQSSQIDVGKHCFFSLSLLLPSLVFAHYADIVVWYNGSVWHDWRQRDECVHWSNFPGATIFLVLSSSLCLCAFDRYKQCIVGI